MGGTDEVFISFDFSRSLSHERLKQKRKQTSNRCQEALEFSPESPTLLTTVGLLHLHLGDSHKAFEYLGNALTHDPRDSKAILAAG